MMSSFFGCEKGEGVDTLSGPPPPFNVQVERHVEITVSNFRNHFFYFSSLFEFGNLLLPVRDNRFFLFNFFFIRSCLIHEFYK